MSRSPSIRHRILKFASTALVVSSLALGTQAGAWKNGCETIVWYTQGTITIYGVDFPVLIRHETVHCS